MKLVVGLGNPGPRYAFSRHNVGWLVIDELLERLDACRPRARYHGLFWGPFRRGDDEFALVKPTAFMNLSGRSVEAACRNLPLPDTSRLLIVYDDIHLPLGKMRFRRKGSAGGHNGMASIISALGTEGIPRLRLGVDAPSGETLSDWVLSDFARSEEPLLNRVLETAVGAVEAWLEGTDMEVLAARYNGLALS